MEFGVHLPTGYPYAKDCHIKAALQETAISAEALNFDTIWVNDAIFANTTSQPELAGLAPIEPLITLASFIHLVPNINLGAAVLVLPQRNAFVVAKQIAALDLLSDGRLTLGIGVGHREAEFALLGADFKNRGAITDEAIEVLRTLWHEPKSSYSGKYHQFSDALVTPKPTPGRPPIWIGGGSQAAIRRVAQLGDGWLAWGLEVDEFQDGVSRLHNLTNNRPAPTLALELGVRIYLDGQDPPTSLPNYHFKPTLAGYPDEIIRKLKAYQEIGLEHLLCIFYTDKLDDQLEQMHLFAEHIAPQFAQ